MAVASSSSVENKMADEINMADDVPIHWVEAHPECAVCLQPCLHPVLLPCSHIFCFLCVKGFAVRNKKCALCRSTVTLDYFDSPVIVEVIHDDKSKIENQEETEQDCYDWFYEGRNGWWQYDKRASQILNNAFRDEKETCELIVSGFSYVIDLEKMVQFRKNKASRQRRIKRDKCNAESKGVAGLRLPDRTTLPTKQPHVAGSSSPPESGAVVPTSGRSKVSECSEPFENGTEEGETPDSEISNRLNRVSLDEDQ